MPKKYKKIIISLLLIFILDYILIKAINDKIEITKEMIGHLSMISIVVLYFFTVHLKTINDFFEKIPKFLSAILFWGILFALV
ncbi:MAG TPA: hypothetical protein VJ926_03185 [Patescibacteria group bacterium]|nr:hypothetical protein [Patescibacteria group bacterium]